MIAAQINLTEHPDEKDFRSHNEFELAIANALASVDWRTIDEVINAFLPDGYRARISAVE